MSRRRPLWPDLAFAIIIATIGVRILKMLERGARWLAEFDG